MKKYSVIRSLIGLLLINLAFLGACKKDDSITIVDPPPLVMNIDASDSLTNKIALSWDAVSDVEMYEIRRALIEDTSNFDESSLTFNSIGFTNNEIYFDFEVEAGSVYAYLIFAYNKDADIIYEFKMVVGATIKTTIPTATASITASDYSTNTIELNWKVIPGAEYYIVEAASIYDEDDFDVDEAYFYEIVVTGEEEFTHTDLYEESTYAYRVTCYNSEDDVIYKFPIVFGKTVGVVEFFEGLADATAGIMTEYGGANELDEVIVSVITDYIGSNTDLVFLIDMTGSMYDDIYTVQSSIEQIIEALPSGVKVGVANYGDNNIDDPWFNFTQLESSPFANSLSFIEGIYASGGGDWPESVYDGIYETVDVMDWSEPNKAIIVIGDAGPLEGELTNHSRDEVIAKCTEAGIAVNLYPIILSSSYKSGRTNAQK